MRCIGHRISRNNLNRSSFHRSNRLLLSSSSSSDTPIVSLETSDVLITGLNGAQDISIKVVSCRELVQEAIIRNDLSSQSAKALGELMSCALMMGSGLKSDETMQINMVGNTGVKNLMAITDGELRIRGMVGQPRFSVFPPTLENVRTRDLIGDGQIQVVRNHPVWKQPMNGIVDLRDAKISLNMALYMAESEQRSAAIITDVKVDGNLCRYALGVMVERLPGAIDTNIETSISNLEQVESKGLRTYLERTVEERLLDTDSFRSMELPLNAILDDCLKCMSDDSIRWTKKPTFRCGCGIEKVWTTLRLLPKSELVAIINEPTEFCEVKCEFCGTNYQITKNDISEKLINATDK